VNARPAEHRHEAPRVRIQTRTGWKRSRKVGYVKGEEGQFNPETGMVEGKWGFEGFVEEIEIKGGSIGFEPA
jgi:hypothetical protein